MKRLLTFAASLLVFGRVSPAFGGSQSAALGVSVTVTRSCAVNTSLSAVNVTCSRGATPGLISGASTTPLPLSSAPPPMPANGSTAASGSTVGGTTTTSAATSGAAATPATPQLVSSVVSLSPQTGAGPSDGTAPDQEEQNQVTINF